MNDRRLSIPVLLFILAAFVGCDRRLEPEEYLRRYEAQALVSEVQGEYRIETLLAAPDYLAVRQIGELDSTVPFDSLRSGFASGIHVNVAFKLAHPTGQMEDAKYDLLNAYLANGQAAYAERFEFLSRRLGPLVYLESPTQGKIHPKTYYYSRSFGLGTANSFLFVFPLESDGSRVEPEKCRFVLEDIGLGIGTVSRKLVKPRSISLKVAT